MSVSEPSACRRLLDWYREHLDEEVINADGYRELRELDRAALAELRKAPQSSDIGSPPPLPYVLIARVANYWLQTTDYNDPCDPCLEDNADESYISNLIRLHELNCGTLDPSILPIKYALRGYLPYLPFSRKPVRRELGESGCYDVVPTNKRDPIFAALYCPEDRLDDAETFVAVVEAMLASKAQAAPAEAGAAQIVAIAAEMKTEEDANAQVTPDSHGPAPQVPPAEARPAPALEETRPRRKRRSSDDVKSRITNAARIVAESPDLSVAEIAKKVGLRRQQLSQNEMFQRARAMATRNVKKGSKSADGNLEAIDDCDP